MLSRRMLAVSLAVGTVCLLTGTALLAKSPSGAAFTYGGFVVNAQGKALAGVEVTAIHQHDAHSHSYIDVVKTDARGRFLINRKRAMSGEQAADVKGGTIQLQFSHPDYAYVTLEEMQKLDPIAVTQLKVTLPEGRTVAGRVVDGEHQPVVGALVEMTFGSDYAQRRGGTTDARGQFVFRGLPGDAGTVQVLTVGAAEPMLTARTDVAATQSDAGTLVATPITLPPGAVVHSLFGMKLCDVDTSLQAAFHLPQVGGVLVLEPGRRGQGWGLQRGDQFFIVGSARVKDFAGFTGQLLALRQAAGTASGSDSHPSGMVRVVWNFSRPDSDGTNTQYLPLNAADVSALAALQKV